MPTNTSNMSLVVPTIGTDSGLVWEQSVNSNSLIIDQHTHAPGSGVPITPDGISINASLPFNGQAATSLQACVFSAQSALTTRFAVYSKGVDLYFNDGSGNVVRITSGGSVNSTSSGISDGTATASFVTSVLVVNQDTNKPANIKAGSLLMGNNTTSPHYLTLQPPNAMAADYSVTLPATPVSTKIMVMDSSGNMAASYSVDESTLTITANVMSVKSAGLTGTQMSSSINLPGNAVKENGKNVVVSNTNAATNSLSIIRGYVNGNTGNAQSGEGFSSVRNSTGSYTITFTTAFISGDVPAVTITTQSQQIIAAVTSANNTGFSCVTTQSSPGVDTTFAFIVVGERAS